MYSLEKVEQAINDLADCDAVALWNYYCEGVSDYDSRIEYNEIDSLCEDLTPSQVLSTIDLNNYRVNDEYVTYSIYGWRSFNYIDDGHCPFDIDELAQYIVDNEVTFGFLDDDDITDFNHYSDFDYEEFVKDLDDEAVKSICERNEIDLEDAREKLIDFLCTIVEDTETLDMPLKEHLKTIVDGVVSEDDLDNYAEF